MSTVTGPFTILPTGAGSRVQMPQPDSGNQLGALVLDNLSTYILQVSVGPNVFYQAPLVEAKYDLTTSFGQPVNVTAIQPAGDVTTSGQLAPTWYSIGEQLAGVWPIALSGPAEVAAAVAAALLNSGIPNVFNSTQIANAVTLFGDVPQVFDVHTFASLELVADVNIHVGGNTQDGVLLTYANGSSPTDFSQFPVSQYIISGPSGDNVWGMAARVPVEARFVQIQLMTGAHADTALLTMWGTNRATPGFDVSTYGAAYERWRWVSGAGGFAAPSTNIIANRPQNSPLMTGQCDVTFGVSDPFSDGYLTATVADGQGNQDEIYVMSFADLRFVNISPAGNPANLVRIGRASVNLPGAFHQMTMHITSSSAVGAGSIAEALISRAVLP